MSTANKQEGWSISPGQLHQPSYLVIFEQVTYGPDTAPAPAKPPSLGKAWVFLAPTWWKVFIYILYMPEVGTGARACSLSSYLATVFNSLSLGSIAKFQQV